MKFKKLLRNSIFLLSALSWLGLQAMPVSAEALPVDEPVTATATVDGFEGPITVEVVADQYEIYSITVTEHEETIGIGDNVIQWLPPAMIDQQKIDVDVVANATETSNALIQAVKDALLSVGIDPTVFDGNPIERPESTGEDAASPDESGADEADESTAAQDTEAGEDAAAQDIEAGEDVTAQDTEANEAVDTLDAEGSEAAEEDQGQEYITDIVIVGAGGAGMTAAIEATDMGEEVILVESQSMVGGNSVRSTGGLNAARTTLQDQNEFSESAGVEKQLAVAEESYADNEFISELAGIVKDQWTAYQENPEGYFDSVELFELDTMIGGKGINDPELVKTLCENSAEAVSWLESIGAPLPSVSSFGGASVKRIHRPVNEEGKTVSVGSYIVPILQQNLEDRGVTILLNTTAEEILTDENGSAVGIKATNQDGEQVVVHAKAVIMATGGFGANLDMVTEYKPELEGFITTNASGAQGQGLAMAQALGADTVDLDQIQIHPTVMAENGALITEGLRGDGAILVNEEGKRFIDEVGTRDVVSAAEIAQPGSHSYLIIDQAMVDASSVIQGYIKAGYTVTGETYEELAEALNIDAETFAQTMTDWNEYVIAQEDPDFGRTSFAAPLDMAPFYAIDVTAGIHHTMGGLKINMFTEVLNTDGDVIPGLFAAGEVTGGVHGANRLGGNAVADFTVFGYLAGQNAALYTED